MRISFFFMTEDFFRIWVRLYKTQTKKSPMKQKIYNDLFQALKSCILKIGYNILTSFSSSSKVNSFFLTTLSWLRKLNSAAFFWSLANLFSYLETFFKAGLTLLGRKHLDQFLVTGHYTRPKTRYVKFNCIQKEKLVDVSANFDKMTLLQCGGGRSPDTLKDHVLATTAS